MTSLSSPEDTPGGDVHKRIMSSAQLFERCQYQLSKTDTLLWGAHIRSAAVTYIVGETSVGKTVFLHNLAYSLAKGEEFLGTVPSKALKVLYIDFESNDEILAEHLSLIGTAPGWDFLNLNNVTPGEAFIRELQPLIASQGYEVVIIDPLMEAVPVNDENDNASANKQMLVFRELARNTRAGVVVVHNSGAGGGTKNKKFFGRGATARQDRADIGINVKIAGDGVREFEVVKSRSSNLGERVVFRFADELGYEVVETNSTPSSVIERLTAQVLANLQAAGKPVSASLLHSLFGGSRGSATEKALSRTLSKLVQTGRVTRPQRGFYCLANSPSASGEGSSLPGPEDPNSSELKSQAPVPPVNGLAVMESEVTLTPLPVAAGVEAGQLHV